jgi:hypothetical protein
MAANGFVIIVSGLPRSGTSVMMQMLDAGGVPILTDGHRPPDIDNPRGYFELEAVKAIAHDRHFLNHAEGKAVKMVHALLPHLPLDRSYRVIFMRRDLDEVLASQRKMLDRQGHAGAGLTDTQLKAVYTNQLQQVHRWLTHQGNQVRVLEVDYGGLISDPKTTARAINNFLGGALNEQAMAAVVDPALHRNRK